MTWSLFLPLGLEVTSILRSLPSPSTVLPLTLMVASSSGTSTFRTRAFFSPTPQLGAAMTNPRIRATDNRRTIRPPQRFDENGSVETPYVVADFDSGAKRFLTQTKSQRVSPR